MTVNYNKEYERNKRKLGEERSVSWKLRLQTKILVWSTEHCHYSIRQLEGWRAGKTGCGPWRSILKCSQTADRKAAAETSQQLRLQKVSTMWPSTCSHHSDYCMCHLDHTSDTMLHSLMGESASADAWADSNPGSKEEQGTCLKYSMKTTTTTN